MVTASQPADSPDPQATITALNAVIKALVIAYGEPQATDPPTFTLAIPAPDLVRAGRTALTITQQRNDLNPDPFILMTVEGI